MPKYPSKLGECIDLAYALREKRLVFQREAEAKIKSMVLEEDEIEQHIIRRFKRQEIETARGPDGTTAAVSRLVVPTVKDWPGVFRWIAENDAWDLMEKRMARVAYRDRAEPVFADDGSIELKGQQIPGTEPFVKVSLSLTRTHKDD